MSQWINNRPSYSNELYHYGVMGMKWGIRNYQPYPSDYKGTGVYKGKKGVEYGTKRDVKKYTKSLQREQKAKNSRAGQSAILHDIAAKRYARAAKKDASSEKAILRKNKMEYWDKTSKDYLNAAQKHYKDVRKVYGNLKLQKAADDRTQAKNQYIWRSIGDRYAKNLGATVMAYPIGFGVGAGAAAANLSRNAAMGLGYVGGLGLSGQAMYKHAKADNSGIWGLAKMNKMQKTMDAKEYNRKNYLRTNSTGARHSQKNGFKNGELVNEKQARAAYKKQLLANGFSENKAKWLSERVYENSLQNLAGSPKQLKYHISEMKKLYGI